MSASRTHDLSALRRRIGAVGLRDERRLLRRLDKARSRRAPDERASLVTELEASLAGAEHRIARREGVRPELAFPAELPVSARRHDIAAALEQHQVVIVAGETGSGKTTQLPKIALELGRGIRGAIGHTQPRRIAARSVAARIAEECGTEVGGAVGYAVRFDDRTSDETLVKVMTDGILLAEIRSDPFLRQYDTLIIDEAHERSLSIDFLLGYLKRLLPRRRDLKVVITSATIDPARFAELFDDAPIIEVSGRTYPVEVRYHPIGEREDGDPLQAIADALDELAADGPGDVLVFLSGEREIRDAADHLRQHVNNRKPLRGTEVLPLYGRLSVAEQHKVFERHTSRRVILATNVAETSLTVPGISYVIDAGTARISRYSARLKVQRLPIEPISQASARQRAGRCGRTSDGICIRLYSEEDFEGRSEFTDPEILRTNLASVILHMTSLDLGAMQDFPFLDPPDARSVRDGVDLLTELGAIEHDPQGGKTRLTAVGRTLAQLPLDPRMGRMLVEAARNGCLREVLVIVSGMSIQDPRERPAEHQQAADTVHRRFLDPDSDFAAYLNLWDYLSEQRKALSSSAFRRMCRDEYLHYLRVREWQDVHALLRQSAAELKLSTSSTPAASDVIHQSLLAGLLSHIGLAEMTGREYIGARQARFAIFPGSGLAKKPPRWVMAGELVETSRLWARTVAKIDPAWIEDLAGHLVRRDYSEPHWSKRRASVVARERVTLYGVPIVVDRPVSYGAIDPELSRELFIRHALVEGEWSTQHPFFARNRSLLDDVEDLERRARRRDIRVDDEDLVKFYDSRIGADVVSGRHFDTWWKRTRREQPDLLDLDPADLVRGDTDGHVSQEAYPSRWSSGSFDLPLTYAFEPGADEDGITVDVPLSALPQLDPAEFLWQVPGHRTELVTALIKTLPKGWRKQFAPARSFAERVLAAEPEQQGPLVASVTDQLRRLTGVVVPADAFDPSAVPDHLLVAFRIVDDGREVGRGKDLDLLKRDLRPQVRTALAEAASGIERTGLTSWSFGALPRQIETSSKGHQVVAYPTLVARPDAVDVGVVESRTHQLASMRTGLRRLLMLTVPSPVPRLLRSLSNRTKLVLATAPYPTLLDLAEDCVAAAVDQLVDDAGGPVWDADDFARLVQVVRTEIHDATGRVLLQAGEVLDQLGDLQHAIDVAAPAYAAIIDDIGVQISWLVFPGFVSEVGAAPLAELPRYLRAARSRITEPVDVVADTLNAAVVQDLEGRYYDLGEQLPAHARHAPAVTAARWGLEELRVSLFAQRLRTAYPVSSKRVARRLDAVADLVARPLM
ncbi:MAG: ATP-dependent RNA helicase HrpA [Nocardioidaceae bacterium]|nr:ATP-dependent RNA helicase HrpA [Nocardioidaceae bacterium]